MSKSISIPARTEKVKGKGKKQTSQVVQAMIEAFYRFNPKALFGSPILFTLWLAAVMATVESLLGQPLSGVTPSLAWQLTAWLWLTLWFANFAETLAEGRGKARADSLKAGMSQLQARKVRDPKDGQGEWIPATSLQKGDLVLVRSGEMIPADGEVIAGIASVNEAAITGESAPVIRESGTDRSGVTGNTTVVSDEIWVRVTNNPGESTLDRMIALVEGAKRQKTPNEMALDALLVGLTLIFLLVVATLPWFLDYNGTQVPRLYLLALFITLIPTTIGGLLSAIGIAGMDRLVKLNVIAKSGRAVEAAGDVRTLLLDKTGTITFGNRMADELIPAPGVDPSLLAQAAMLASLGDNTPEGKSILTLAGKSMAKPSQLESDKVIPFSAETRLSGLDRNGHQYRKGAVDAVLNYLSLDRKGVPELILKAVDNIARQGGTPLLVCTHEQLLGVVYLKDIIKPGIKARFQILRHMGIRTVMITGDNPLTAAAIAAEAGVDDFIAEATPEKKLAYIRQEQADGRMVAMCGDGANDAPALAQADVGLAMNEGTQAAKEAGNLVDLDSNPTKLLDVVLVGKQLLVTRGALTTFSIANDVAKYFAILPALFIAAYPQLGALNLMQLGSPESAILSAIIFNALIIVALVPLALRGVNVKGSAASLLRRNLLIYGLGGLIVPFIGIKLIDLVITGLGLV
ncbi:MULTISPECIES: potassium-transporting ATPase subunit KdpB [Aeromonas]|jgi:K+-transporting ATPase ATPase B chain|uniref:Potassium-transporting ATPase ATP-binding subunit n=2 Tax=Aeromonas TaxID=642 RepID=A0ABX0CVB8_9GAMM|nr:MULTISPECIES: potassium-transporting ATPase subunit KdpB [Aeromonas]MCE9923726.1 potassium-transporting ATPase subunit KdpB [Aeromonas media]MDM5094563.1 potassium-transporting ATPase subunit KdpB [Aeromonas rivipollensis]MDW4563343.1 potassium-transporting ATPase subunit KdpB [Aeromonas rivipollensis]NEX87707.1 potassium-transporting ATPase subunit KdpB [Aeromonas rivipollensis]NEY05362.1 potassium-transporting ATPase subunit KdpB [Aeromonas rivipollensis]